MAKRTATSELNHDNWNAEEEEEDPGLFKPLSGPDLQSRVIIKARRSLNRQSGDSPFKAASPFAAFSGFASANTASPFDAQKKNSSTEESNPVKECKKDLEKENGSAVTYQEEKHVDAETSNAKCSNPSTSAKDKPARSIEYYRQLQSLNESILKWMQLHITKNACCDFTPVFNDYKKHLDTLNVTYPVKKKDIALSDEETNDSVFKKPATSDSMSSKSINNFHNSKVHSAVRQGNTANKDDETDYGANFTSNTTNTSTFSFGIKRTPTATSSGSPLGPTTTSRGEGAEQEKKLPFQFSFGLKNAQASEKASKPFTFASAPVVKSEERGESEEQEYVPPKNEFVAVSEDDALYSKRCKLFFKKDEAYAEKGVGTLYLKPLDGKTQLLIRADTNLGNILLNIMLSSSLPMSRTGKNNVLVVCIPNPPPDGNKESKEAIPILIRVKTSEDADELLEALNKHKS